jgi:hypothetical protein
MHVRPKDFHVEATTDDGTFDVTTRKAITIHMFQCTGRHGSPGCRCLTLASPITSRSALVATTSLLLRNDEATQSHVMDSSAFCLPDYHQQMIRNFPHEEKLFAWQLLSANLLEGSDLQTLA